MKAPRPRFAPLQPWQVGWSTYLGLWAGGGLAALIAVWMISAAITQPDLQLVARIVVVLFGCFLGLIALGAVDALSTGGARILSATTTEVGIDLTRDGHTWHIAWSQLAAAGISTQPGRISNKGAALDLWLSAEEPLPELNDVGEGIAEETPPHRPSDWRVRILGIARPSIRLLTHAGPTALDDRWLGRYLRG